MNKKYILFVLTFFICLSSMIINAHPRTDEITGRGDTTEYINATFDNPNFGVAFVVETGEIMSWSVPEGAEDITEEEWCYILIDCAEKIFGKESERYEVNKEKFMNMIEEMKNQKD